MKVSISSSRIWSPEASFWAFGRQAARLQSRFREGLSIEQSRKDGFDCNGVLHAKAIEGLKLFNEGKFFEAHEELEEAWKDETSEIRELYQGILQIAVTYLHITRGNYEGALKVYGRSMKWLKNWPDICVGIQVKKFRDDAELVMKEVERLGKENIGSFNTSLF